MTLRDGRYAQDVIYSGGFIVTAQVWVGAKSERERGRPEWTSVPLNAMPVEWLQEVRDAAESALKAAA